MHSAIQHRIDVQWGAGTRADRLRLRALQASFATRPRCDDDDPAALSTLAAELAQVGEKDAALDLLVTASALSWVAGRQVAAQVRRSVRAALAAAGPLDAADARVQAVVAVLDPGPVVQERCQRSELDLELVRSPDMLGAAGLAALARADMSRAGSLLDTAIAEARHAGRTGLLAHLCTLRARSAIVSGDWETVGMAAAEASAAAASSRQALWLAHATVAGAAFHAVRGDTELAWHLAARAEAEAGAAVRDSAQLARGLALLSAERHAEARHVLLSLVRQTRPHGARWDTAVVLGYLAEAFAYERIGTDSGLDPIDDVLQLALWPAAAPVLANLLYARALLADGGEAGEAFVGARQAATRSSPWLAARVDLGYGIWLRRQRRFTEARPYLQAAVHAFDFFGARTWAERARLELRTGSGLQAGSPDQQLTTRELQIARMVADGLTNREIAQRIFLSHRTVGSHLYRIFPKLGISTRAQLAARVQELPTLQISNSGAD
jgi:DNA-binding CsgD family transcriptional regulator